MPDWLEPGAFEFGTALISLGIVAVFALAGWLVSLIRNDVSLVDGMWSLMFLISLGSYMLLAEQPGWRGFLVLALAAIWALRLSVHIFRRSAGEEEDRRYREIRANNQPNFRFKSVYIVFGLQAFLAWLISLPMLAASQSSSPFGWLDGLGILLWLAGMFFEWVGDAQLARFLSAPTNRGKVMKRGLWRYTRHPNYFGEFLLQWGFFMFAVAAGGAWTVFAPILITFFLLRVSGVSLLEKDIEDRRPDYRDYIMSTNAFFPGRPKPEGDHPLFIVVLLCLLLPGAFDPAQAAEPDHVWDFQVFVDDKPVGHHRFYLDREGDTRRLRSEANFEYRLFFLKLYDYQHSNHEVWNGPCLSSIQSRTNANGKEYSVAGESEPGRFVVDSGHLSRELPTCIKTFAYWDAAFLEESRLLNTQTGEYMEVDIGKPQADRIRVRGDVLNTQRYRLSTDGYEIDLWYTADAEWVGLETTAGDGRSLRYVLQ